MKSRVVYSLIAESDIYLFFAVEISIRVGEITSESGGSERYYARGTVAKISTENC